MTSDNNKWKIKFKLYKKIKHYIHIKYELQCGSPANSDNARVTNLTEIDEPRMTFIAKITDDSRYL